MSPITPSPTQSHAAVALVPAAVEPMAPLDHADAALRSRAPLLAVAEPAFLLLALALGALGGAVGHTHPLHALGLRSRLVLARIEGRIRGHEIRRASKPRLVRLDRWDQEVGVVGAPVVDLIVDNDLVLGLDGVFARKM